MNHLLGGLEQRGYLERVAASGDGRARVVELTSKGRELTSLIQELSARIEAGWERELGSKRTADVRAALERLDELGEPGRGVG
jgi:DNA-binding MarR family transcriptional regulator